MTHTETKNLIAAAADLTTRMRAAKRHERRALVLEAAGLGLRFTVIGGKAACVVGA